MLGVLIAGATAIASWIASNPEKAGYVKEKAGYVWDKIKGKYVPAYVAPKEVRLATCECGGWYDPATDHVFCNPVYNMDMPDGSLKTSCSAYAYVPPEKSSGPTGTDKSNLNITDQDMGSVLTRAGLIYAAFKLLG